MQSRKKEENESNGSKKYWPSKELEEIQICPACGGSERVVLHSNAVDNVFYVTKDKWILHQCKSCKSAYLSPRPDKDNIYKAYENYYTHQSQRHSRKPDKELSKIRYIFRMLANGYLNNRFGTHYRPESVFGTWIIPCLFKIRKNFDTKYYFLPKPKSGKTLLDVGCGNGDFLKLAKDSGWTVKGVDPDPAAVKVAQNKGFDVQVGGIEQFDRDKEKFDAITMSHVVEHLHDPYDVIQEAFRLLKPGGFLYIDTPNIESYGAKKYGINWRGMETPRHLVIFSPKGLRNILKNVGFFRIKMKSRSIVRGNILLRSYRIQNGLSPYDVRIKKIPFTEKIKSKIPRSKSKEEFLAVVALKPPKNKI